MNVHDSLGPSNIKQLHSSGRGYLAAGNGVHHCMQCPGECKISTRRSLSHIGGTRAQASHQNWCWRFSLKMSHSSASHRCRFRRTMLLDIGRFGHSIRFEVHHPFMKPGEGLTYKLSHEPGFELICPKSSKSQSMLSSPGESEWKSLTRLSDNWKSHEFFSMADCPQIHLILMQQMKQFQFRCIKTWSLFLSN
jgi:hypothetical protein